IEFYSVFQIFNNLEYSRLLSYLIALFVISGYLPRYSALLHLWLQFSFIISAKHIEGGDQAAYLFTLFILPLLLFDNRRNHWQKGKVNDNFYINTICFLFFVFSQIQFFIIYFIASVSKFSDINWKNGSALYYWFTEPVFGLNSALKEVVLPIFKSSYILSGSTWLVLLLELFIAFSVFYKNKKLKNFILYLGIIFHFLIGIVFGLWVFFLNMTGILLYIKYSSNEK
ncbi:hypothetical protein AABL85_17170, partial [Myroides odoratimimus]